MPAEVDNQAVTLAPLTRSQLMIWTGQKLQADEPLYNMALSFRIRGEVSLVLFQTAFDALVTRCDALRTTFVTINGVPKQRFHEHYRYHVDYVDLSASPDAEAALQAWQQEHSQAIFDLEHCLFESTLLKIADSEFVWFFNQHHLTTDAWSTSLIYRHLQNYYALARTGQLEQADYLPDYQTYVGYEAAQRDSKAVRRAQEYWQQQLQVPSPPNRFYRPTPRNRRAQTQRVQCAIGTTRSARLKALADDPKLQSITRDLSRFQVFATTLIAWLYRLNGQRAVTIGTPNHNRGTAAHKNTVGLFIEIYPLRIDIDEDETFISLYKKVALNTRALLMNAPPGASGFELHRAYDVILNYITASFGAFDNLPMDSEWVHADYGDRNHLLRMQVEDFDHLDQFRVFFDVNIDVFVGAERDYPGQHFVRMLDAFLDNPDATVAAVDLLTPAQRTELAAGFSPHTPAEVPATTVIQRFEQQALRTPDAIALSIRHTDSDTVTTDNNHLELSYADLHKQVLSLSAQLQDLHGLSPGKRVGILLPRSVGAIVSILATLHCGASYVPVDPAYPEERIRFLLADAAVNLLISGKAVHDNVVAPDHNHLGTELAILLLEDLHAPVGTEETVSVVASMAQPDDSAYVLYTSGSTGKPKGVEVTHRSLSNYIAWAATQYTAGQTLNWPLFTSLSFDLTITSIFVPLTTGGQLLIYPQPLDPHVILVRRVIEDNLIDVIKLTPAHLSLLQAMDLSASRLRSIVVGGEDFKTELARSMHHYFGGNINLYNEYGPTEATVACMIHRYRPDADDGVSVPVGRAIDNARVYVLNAMGQLQPTGVIGELYIGGTGVARGYLNRDDLTQERFVDNPFCVGEKMYRSGDLACVNPDGTLTCLGRADAQFKINAVRIEPGEIEAALLEHPLVTDSSVQLFTTESPKHSSDATASEAFCTSCGLSGNHPAAMLDADSLCRICHEYAAEREQALSYFGSARDLDDIVRQIKSEVLATTPGAPNCMMLLSGGKDSTYALCQIVDLGLTPLVFTLDNGFISEGAKSNMRRVVEHLGLELIVGSTPAMNEIFRDSLNRFSNVCNGCFKTIYTLSMKIAVERGIKHIFTGLSRGQIFETRVADLFRQRVFAPSRIDALIIEARKAYHRADDAVTRALDVSHLQDDKIFSEIQYVDYYRYTDVSLGEMLTYLRDRVPWVRPADTGRSTNCLINEAGIYVHKKERGYHNYSLPYSWDVRLGHKERDAARDELNDDINLDNVQKILHQIDYTPRETPAGTHGKSYLTGYYVAAEALDPEALKSLLKKHLPEEFIPSHFVHMESLPLTSNGKVDRAALPHPDMLRPLMAQDYAAPEGQVETTLAKIWARVFGLDRVGVNDNFFELGGDSIINIQIVSLASKEGLMLSPQQVFEYPTISELTKVVGTARELASEQGTLSGEVTLTPIQHGYFAHALESPNHYAQVVLLEAAAPVNTLALEEALRLLMNHHDVLRSRFVHTDNGWHQEIIGDLHNPITVNTVNLPEATASDEAKRTFYAEQMHKMVDRLDIAEQALLHTAVIDRGASHGAQVMVCIHHLVVDAVSWWILIEDLEEVYRSLVAGRAPSLPLKTTSMQHWGRAVKQYAHSNEALATLPEWRELKRLSRNDVPLPVDAKQPGRNTWLSVATESSTLGSENTHALMTSVTSNWRTQPHDLMLLALEQTLHEWSGASAFTVDVEAHGREAVSDELDLLRTVGWFTSIYPVRLAYGVATDHAPAQLVDSLRQLRDAMRRIPAGGIAYGALRYLQEDDHIRNTLAGAPSSPVLFNYLGTWRKQTAPEAAFSFAKPLMAVRHSDDVRPYQLEINAAVFEGRLQVDWTYSKHLHQADTITQLARRFMAHLRSLIIYCANYADGKRSTMDFPTAELSQGDLDNLLEEFGEQ